MNLVFSVIVPTYNIETYIAQCLESLAGQTLPQHMFEVIVIDDHSTDRSKTIVEECKGIKNLKVFTAPRKIGNGGPGLARNRGLEEAKGEYIVFLDGDDYLEPDALETIYQNAQDKPDAVMYDWTTSEDLGKTPHKRDFDNVSEDKDTFIPNYFGMSISGDVIYTSVKREIFVKNNLLFEQHQHEDVPMIFKMLYLSRSIKKLQGKVLYRKRSREGSVVNSIAYQYVDGYLNSWPEIMRFLLERDARAADKYMRYYLRGINGLIYTLLSRCLRIARIEGLQERKMMYWSIFKKLSQDEFIKDQPFDGFPNQTKKDAVAHEFYALMSADKLSDEEVSEFEEKKFPLVPLSKEVVRS